jgi:4-amino-4-deoxy-L-arabinose transferase-like glycosyltransferase
MNMTEKTGALGLLARGTVILLGVLALLGAYYWTHKPFSIDYGLTTALRIVGGMLDLATAAALTVLSAGIGRGLLARLPMSHLSRLERLALAGLVGFGVVGLAALALGMVGLFNRVALWGLIALGALVFRRGVRAWAGDLGGVVRDLRLDSAWSAFSAVIAAAMLLMALTEAISPPIRWDSLTYQLVAPARYLESGRVEPYDDNFYLGFPQGVNLLFGIAVSAFGRETAAAPVHFMFGLFGVLAAMGAARRCAGKTAGWTVALLMMSAYNLAALFGWAYTDLAALAYGAGTLCALLAWRETGGRGWLLLIGALVGFAVGVKYTAGALALAAGMVILVYQPRRVIVNGLITASAAALAFAPWAVRGWLHYGNPIYPFVFGGLHWDALRAELFNFTDRGLLATGNAWQALFVPVSATVFGADLSEGFGFTAGPWLLTVWLLLPLVWRWLDARARRLAALTAIALIPLIAVWTVTSLGSSVGMQTRLMAMSLSFFAVAGAVGLTGLMALPKKPLAIGFIVRALIVITVIFNTLDALHIWLRESAPRYAFGLISMDDYGYINTFAYYPAMRSLEPLPEGAQVRFMWEPRGYYCPAHLTCTADALLDHWLYPAVTGSEPDAIFASYRAAGDDYLLVWRAGYDHYRDLFDRYGDQIDGFYPALERHMVEVWTDGLRYTLYGWRE